MSPVVVLILLALWVGCLLVAEVVAVVICARLSFILPGRALKHVPRTWRDAWEATRSLSWRLLVGTLLVAIPGYVVVSLLATWQRSDIASIVLGALLEAAAYILTFCLFTAFVSLAYQRRTSDLTQPFD
jgi:membrane-anchored glycerophosphoryl diester phosphodiesterase (GDPDase)